MSRAVYDAQRDWKDVRFLLLEAEPVSESGRSRLRGNTESLEIDASEAGYLAGYAAVQAGYTHLGYIGQKNEENGTKYGTGYALGAEAAAADLGLGENSITLDYTYRKSSSVSPSIRIPGCRPTCSRCVFFGESRASPCFALSNRYRHSHSEAKAGRPPKKIDYDKIVELKRKDLDVNSICKELGISRALYYREVVSSIDSLEVGTRIEYRPIDEECWTKGTVMINERNTKYVQCDDGIVDYPRKRDVIRMI